MSLWASIPQDHLNTVPELSSAYLANKPYHQLHLPYRLENSPEEVCDERPPSQTQATRPILPALRLHTLHALHLALYTPDLCALHVRGVDAPQLALHPIQQPAGPRAKGRGGTKTKNKYMQWIPLLLCIRNLEQLLFLRLFEIDPLILSNHILTYFAY